MIDYLDELLQNEEQPFGSGYESSEPEYLKRARQSALESEEDSKDTKRRLKEFEDWFKQDQSKNRDKYYQQKIKSHYGFTPNNTGKKIAAGALDTLFTSLGIPLLGGNRQAANKDYQEDYKNKQDAFKQLFSSDINVQKAQNQANNNYLTQLLREKQINNQAENAARTDQTKRELGFEGLNLKDRIAKGDQAIRQQLADSKDALDQANIGLMNEKTQGLESVRKFKENWNKQHPDYPWEMFSSLKRDQIELMIVNGMIPNNVAQRWLNLKSDLANLKEPQLSTVKTVKGVNVDEMGNSHPVLLQQNVPTGKQSYQRRFGTEQEQTPQEIIKNKVLGNQNFIPQQTNRQKITNTVMNDGVVPKDPVEASQHYLKLATNTKDNPYWDLQGVTDSSANKTIEIRKKWHQTAQVLNGLSDNAGDAYSKGELQKFRGAFNQNSFVKQLRTILGRSTSELSQDNSALFGLAEHLQSRLKSGRPALGLIQMVEEAVGNKMDTPEAYFKTQLLTSLLSDLTLKQVSNGYFNKAYGKLEDAGGNWAKAVKDVIDETVKMATPKNGKAGVYKRPTIDQVFQKAYQNLKGNNKEPSFRDKLKRLKIAQLDTENEDQLGD